MSRPASSWLRGCAWGCGVVAVLLILAVGVGSVVMQRPFRDAIDAREKLEKTHGPTASFTPAPDGAIHPDRVEAFLHVRRSLQAVCKGLEESSRRLEALDELEDGGEPTTGEVQAALWGAMKTALGMGSRMGEFFRARNAALAEVDMGLGEYTYLYVLAYAPRLRGERTGGEGRRLSERVGSDLRQMLRNQRTALADLGPGTAADLGRALDREITALERDAGRVPWQDGLPPPLEASLAPYRDQLDAVFCPDAFNLELTRNERFWIGIRGD